MTNRDAATLDREMASWTCRRRGGTYRVTGTWGPFTLPMTLGYGPTRAAALAAAAAHMAGRDDPEMSPRRAAAVAAR